MTQQDKGMRVTIKKTGLGFLHFSRAVLSSKRFWAAIVVTETLLYPFARPDTMQKISNVSYEVGRTMACTMPAAFPVRDNNGQILPLTDPALDCRSAVPYNLMSPRK